MTCITQIRLRAVHSRARRHRAHTGQTPGVAATVLCVRMTYKTNHRADRAEESED